VSLIDVFWRVLGALAIPDDQGRDWYGWATNQCGHALVGVVLAGAVWFLAQDPLLAIVVPFYAAVLKEAADYLRPPQSWAALRDGLRDAGFALAGALIALALATDAPVLFLVVTGGAAAVLVAGVVSRARRALAEGPRA